MPHFGHTFGGHSSRMVKRASRLRQHWVNIRTGLRARRPYQMRMPSWRTVYWLVSMVHVLDIPVSQSLQIWRTWIVWGRNWWVIIAPVATTLLTAGLYQCSFQSQDVEHFLCSFLHHCHVRRCFFNNVWCRGCRLRDRVVLHLPSDHRCVYLPHRLSHSLCQPIQKECMALLSEYHGDSH